MYYYYEIKRGAFAGGNNCTAGDALQSFAFPEGNLNIGYTDADAHDYILAGRPTLSSVTFGTSLNDTIPVNTPQCDQTARQKLIHENVLGMVFWGI